MGKNDKARFLIDLFSYGLDCWTLGCGTKVRGTHNNAVAIANLVKRCECADMFVVGRNDLFTCLPVSTEDNDVQPLASIVSERNLIWLCVQEMCDAIACCFEDMSYTFKSCCPQATIAPFRLHTLLHGLYDTIRQRAKSPCIEV